LERGVNPFTSDSGFLVNDPNYAPFGCSWLRGVTPARFALVELVCFIFAVRQTPDGFLVASFYERILSTILFAQINVAASMPMLVLVNLADRRTDRSTSGRRIVALSLAVITGAVAYAMCVGLTFGLDEWETIWPLPMLASVGFFLRALLTGGLLTAVLYFSTRETAIAAALQTTRLTGVALDKQMAEAQLRVLQAQIEPHFLFNTLAHIKRLYLIDAAQGKAMLNNLSSYLRAALPQMRQSDSTLGRELALARAYLNVLHARMGERLGISISVPHDLCQAELPPMMLSTLVENAIKHGLSPLPEGGTVEIAAVRDGDRLRISVADDGVGFQGFSGSGVGLANTRARLAALYGADGLLTFAANPTRGVTVAIALPFRVLSAEGAAT
jgi:signal transduction histidine kinase